MSEPGGSEALTHEQVLADGYDAFNRRDTARLRELMVADFQWHEAAEVAGRKVCRSADEFAAYIEGFKRLWDEFSFELLELAPGAGDTLLATVRGRGRGKASPDAFELTIHHVWRFREGRVARRAPTRSSSRSTMSGGFARAGWHGWTRSSTRWTPPTQPGAGD